MKNLLSKTKENLLLQSPTRCHNCNKAGLGDTEMLNYFNSIVDAFNLYGKLTDSGIDDFIKRVQKEKKFCQKVQKMVGEVEEDDDRSVLNVVTASHSGNSYNILNYKKKKT